MQKEFDVYEFSKRLNLLLEERKLTINELAEKTGLSRKQISLYKNLMNKQDADTSVPNINVSTVLKFAQALETSTDYLLGLSEVDSTNYLASPTMEKLGLSEKSIQAIIDNKGQELTRNNYSYSDPQSEILNMVFESDLYYTFIIQLHRFLNFDREFYGKKLDGAVQFKDEANMFGLGIHTLLDYKLFLKNNISECFSEMKSHYYFKRIEEFQKNRK